MATSPDFVRLASSATRPLAEIAFDALREAVLIVDARSRHYPLVMANASAHGCLLGEGAAESLVNFSLYSFLGAATDPAVEAALATQSRAEPCIMRMLGWRLPRGETPLMTELKLLVSPVGQRLVMLTFAEPAEPGLFAVPERLPLDLLILDDQLNVTYANASAERTAGGGPGGILTCSGTTLLPTAAIPRPVLERALEGKPYHDEALAVAGQGDATRWFEVDVQPLKDAAGIAGLAVLSLEVTERRARQAAATDSELHLLALTEHARDIITVAGRDGRLTFISGGVRNSLGYTVEERRSNSIFEHIHPEDIAGLRARFAQLVAGTISTFSQQYRIRHKSGPYRWLESSYVAALDNPRIRGVVINSRDITERRQAENRLAQREEIFRLAADAVNGIIFEWDLAHGIVHRSRGVQEVLGIEPAELAREGAWSARIHPEDDRAYSQTVEAALQKGRGWNATYRIRDARGRYRSLLERGLIQRSEGGIALRAIGCAVDVSEIRRLTDLLAETQHAAKMGGWEYTYASRELTWTDEMFRIYETAPADFAVSWESMLEQCMPESRQRFDEHFRAAESSSGDFDLELEIITLASRRLWVRIIGHIEKFEGRPCRAFGSVQNVHAQKLAQIALEKSTDWLKLSMNMAHMHAWRWDRATDTLDFANVDGRMVHLPRVFPGMKKLMARVHPKDRVAVRGAIDRAFESHEEVQAEFRLRSHDGGYRSYAAVAQPLFDAAAQPSALVGVTQDITARHDSEARVRRSEELLRTTTANTADTLLLVDTDLKIRFLNRDVRGMTIEHLIGRPIAVLLPEPARAAVIARLRGVLTTAETATFEFDAPVGAATEYFETRAVLVRDDGTGTGLSITVRNITERKRLEQEILDVSSRERQTIGRDLHDGLGQELTGVALMLRALATRIRKESPDAVVQVNEIVGLVNQSIETARALARSLLPVNTEGGGLSAALRALADRSGALYGIEVKFRAEVSPDVSLSEASASHLYRIAQEALTNTARHADATAVRILLQVDPKRFLLEISDNGRGLSETGRSVLSMGLKIMKYRAGIIGATFEIAPNHPHGTIVRITGGQARVAGTQQSEHAI